MACKQAEPPPKTESSKQPAHEIKNWQLNSEGQHGWKLSAKRAWSEQGKWQFEELRWFKPQAAIIVTCPQALQTSHETFLLPAFHLKSNLFQGQGKTGILNLKQQDFSGNQLELTTPQSFIKAEAFKLQAQKLSLKKVYASFKRE